MRGGGDADAAPWLTDYQSGRVLRCMNVCKTKSCFEKYIYNEGAMILITVSLISSLG